MSFNLVGAVTSLISSGLSNSLVNAVITEAVPQLVGPLLALADEHWPGLDPEFKLIAAFTTAHDPTFSSKWQDTLNRYFAGDPSFTPLAVDGDWKEKTTAATRRLQTALGIDPDGFPGTLTQAALTVAKYAGG